MALQWFFSSKSNLQNMGRAWLGVFVQNSKGKDSNILFLSRAVRLLFLFLNHAKKDL